MWHEPCDPNSRLSGGCARKWASNVPLQDNSKAIQDLEATVRKIYLLGLLYVGLSLVYLVRAPDYGAISDAPPGVTP
jgi:hypothetical protein